MFATRAFNRSPRWRKPGVDTTPPVISGVTESDLTSSGVTIEWLLDEPATGYVEYGLTTAYGSTTTFEPSLLTGHRQSISGLTAGTPYYYRIVSTDAAGNTGTATGDFTTSGAAPAATVYYGPGVGFDDKGNIEISDGLAKAGIRFVARHANGVKTARYLRFQYRNDAAGYGAGNRGIFTVGIQADAGGVPSGTWLGGTITWDPATTSYNDGALLAFSGGPAPTQDGVYWVVWQNDSATPLTDYSSLNFPYTRIASLPTPRQPRWEDDVPAVYNTYSGGWTLDSRHLPAFDLEYSDGTHDMGFGGVAGGATTSDYGTIDGTAKVRCRFTPTASQTVNTVGWRLKHKTGTSTSDITATLKVNGGATLGTATLSGAGLSEQASAPTIGNSSGEWTTGTLSGGPHSLSAGTEYVLELSTTAGSTYWSRTMLYRDSSTSAGEHMYDDFGEGRAEKSADGSSWASVVPAWSAYVHHQFYFSDAA